MRSCVICGIEYKPKKPTQKFCSKKCMGIGESKENHYRYGTGKMGCERSKMKNGYVVLHRHGFPPIYEHRFVAEQALGRSLKENERIHHVDGDKTNNQAPNLVICENEGYHQFLHARQRVIQAGGVPGKHLFCGFCKKLLPLEMFRVHRQRTDRCGRCGWCILCARIKDKENRLKRLSGGEK